MKQGTNSAKFMKIAHGVRGVYIPHFDQISVKLSVLGVLYPNRGTNGGEIWHGGGDHRATCRPCGAKNLKIIL